MTILRDKLKKEGQSYWDRPVTIFPRTDLLQPTRIEVAVARAFRRDAIRGMPRPIIVGYRRVMLDWEKSK